MDNKKNKEKIFPIRLDDETYRQLRKIAYLMEVNMTDIVRDGLKIKLEEAKKILTNSSIVV
jgi:hypothetical protein